MLRNIEWSTCCIFHLTYRFGRIHDANIIADQHLRQDGDQDS
jgi:hypothetical protein